MDTAVYTSMGPELKSGFYATLVNTGEMENPLLTAMLQATVIVETRTCSIRPNQFS